MFAYDFEFDGLYLSDFGFTICSFDSESETNTVSAGSSITFSKTYRNKGKSNILIGFKYDECIKTTFSVCKTNCNDDNENMVITTDEFRDLMRWLNRPEFHRFQIIDNSEKFREPCYFNASFNIEKIFVADELYGLRLTMETDKPFGYGETEKQTFDITYDNNRFKIYDISDEIGETYVDMDIVCKTNSAVSITNEDITGNTMTVVNCKNGESIHIDGGNLIITSSNITHDISSDFNFEFLKIRNTYETRLNNITVNVPCKITVQYTPVIKNIPN